MNGRTNSDNWSSDSKLSYNRRGQCWTGLAVSCDAEQWASITQKLFLCHSSYSRTVMASLLKLNFNDTKSPLWHARHMFTITAPHQWGLDNDGRELLSTMARMPEALPFSLWNDTAFSKRDKYIWRRSSVLMCLYEDDIRHNKCLLLTKGPRKGSKKRGCHHLRKFRWEWKSHCFIQFQKMDDAFFGQDFIFTFKHSFINTQMPGGVKEPTAWFPSRVSIIKI